MKTTFLGVFLLLVSLLSTACAATRYVDLNCATPTAPYTNWTTAATNIQDAVDAADAADLVLVTNGVYASGGQRFSNATNRLVLSKSGVIVQSVNGPEQTVIQGWQVPGTTNGPEAIRCVILRLTTVLSGFTLTNGATPVSQDGGGIWADSPSAVVTNCVITGNSAARYGGGVSGQCTLYNCRLTGNSAMYGGGAYSAITHGIELDGCRVIANSADVGGGLYNVYAYSSFLTDNVADTGGGAYSGNLGNCTVVHNVARIGGGVAGASIGNSVVYYNRGSGAVVNYTPGSYSYSIGYCCTTPLPAGGSGNIDVDPQLASASHLSSSSPCRSAGHNSSVTRWDIDGEVFLNPPSLGCDEYYVGAVTGALSVAISTAYTNLAAGFEVELVSAIDGRTSASVWQFGDGTTVSNRPYAQHAWATPGDYTVTLTAYNESHPEGVAASTVVHVQSVPTHFVRLGSTNAVAPYATWETAAGDIQSAVDAATLPGALVVADDGVYDAGGRAVYGLMTNRVVLDKPLTLSSVNGPASTSIVGSPVSGTTNGDGAIRCVYLADGAAISGFTLTNGATRRSGDAEREQKGGAVWCPSTSGLVTNCVLTGNSSYMKGGGAWGGTLDHCTLSGNTCLGGALAGYGGAAYGSVLNMCLVISNVASWTGGGVSYGLLNNCTLTGNSAKPGVGGAHNSLLNNCISYYNAGNTRTVDNCYNAYSSAFDLSVNFCCTTPMPGSGIGNFTNAPLLVDLAGRDFHLQTNSPCINAGANAYVTSATDFDGKARITGGTVDVGAYEFEQPLSVISYAWLQSYGLPTDGTADFIDSDADAMSNWQEWVASTHPLVSTSALRVVRLVANPPATILTWQSSTNRTYYIQSAANATGQPCFTSIASNLQGRLGTTSFTNLNTPCPGPLFYRVAVQWP
jgi:hypothetical protein